MWQTTHCEPGQYKNIVLLFPLHYRKELNKHCHKLCDNSSVITKCKILTQIVPHISDLEPNSLPHVSISATNLNDGTVKLSFLH